MPEHHQLGWILPSHDGDGHLTNAFIRLGQPRHPSHSWRRKHFSDHVRASSTASSNGLDGIATGHHGVSHSTGKSNKTAESRRGKLEVGGHGG